MATQTVSQLVVGTQLREDIGRNPIYPALLTFWFLLIVVGMNADFGATYAMLGVTTLVTFVFIAVAQAGSWDAFKRILVPTDLSLRTAVPPVALGVVLVLVPLLGYGYLTTGRFYTTSNSFAQNWNGFIQQVLEVATVEETAFRLVFPRVWGGILAQVFFALFHPAVRNVILDNPLAAVGPFVYYFSFGLLFMAIAVAPKASNLPRWLRRWTGVPLDIGIHGAYNLVLILFPALTVLGFSLTFF